MLKVVKDQMAIKDRQVIKVHKGQTAPEYKGQMDVKEHRAHKDTKEHKAFRDLQAIKGLMDVREPKALLVIKV